MGRKLFTDRTHFADMLRTEFIVDGMDAEDIAVTEDAIQELSARMIANNTEGARIGSTYLDVTITVTAYADQAREAVKNAAALLDTVRDDDWRSMIDRGRLDVRSYSDCPIGQVYGGWAHGLQEIEDSAATRGIELPDGWKDAFEGCSNDDPDSCCPEYSPMSVLTLAWLELLTA